MKTITKEYSLYNYDELSQEAQERALNDFRKDNEYFFLSDCMNERLHELLKENNIKDTNDTSRAGTTPTQVMYSLSYSQGDGAMFEGDFEWKGNNITVNHYGHYHHSNNKQVTFNDFSGEEKEQEEEKLAEEFEATYQKICKELERFGYNYIEYEDSEENFIEMCEANEWTFLSGGKMMNA